MLKTILFVVLFLSLAGIAAAQFIGIGIGISGSSSGVVGGGSSSPALLLESGGGYILLETGGKILIEP